MVDFDGKLFFAPMDGEVLDLTDCVDPIFSQGIVGAGVLIIPTGSKVYAPCDGTVSIIANCRHGIAIKNPAGFQVLIHIGIDTVDMDGNGFKSYKKVGDKVESGDLLLEFDLEKIKKAGKNIQSPVVITNPEIKKVEILKKGVVNYGDEFFRICESK